MKFPRIPFKLPQKVTTALGKLVFKTRKLKPDICIIGGVVLGGAAIVVAVVDTWKGKDKITEDINAVKGCKEHLDKTKESNEEFKNTPVMNEMLVEGDKKSVRLAKKKLAVDLFKTYWKTVALSGASFVLIIYGKRQYRRQIIELGTMYATLLESYRQYRKRVVDEYGAEKDQEFAYGIKTIETIDAETGEVVKKTEPFLDKHMASPYARFLNEGEWDEENCRWIWHNSLYSNNKLILESNLRRIQSECNDILRANGWLDLNTVYRKLCLPMTEAGQHVGWVRGGIIDGDMGDDFVDFGVFDDYEGGKYQLPINKAFLDPYSNQRCPLLDFNVICIDGIWKNIYEYDNRSLISCEQRS